MMSIVRLYSLIGDSNVRNHVNKTAVRASASIKSAQVLSCGHLENFVDSLKSVRDTSNVCILACMSNFISSCDGPSSVSQRVQPIIQDIRDALVDSCSSKPDREYLIAPPMYRTSPIWYREGLPEILGVFSQTLGKGSDLPKNLRILPSFPTPEYESDGVHLTAYSGQEYLLHLFDCAQEILERSPELSVVTSLTSESNRVLEDRVMVLEQDHRRLNHVVEHKIAVDAELSDFRTNERFEDCFVISGLPLIPDDITGKEWQKRAVADVQGVLKELMGRELPILFVQNSTKRHQGAEITYTVKMIELSDSKALRRKFGSFYAGGRDERPESLKPFQISNKVTPETLTRISILKLLAKKYRDSNPGSKVKVIGYDSRPTIKIIPAPSASDRRLKTFNYIQAVSKLPTNIPASEMEPILRRINPELSGKLRSLFIILSDDAFKKILRSRKSNFGSAGRDGREPGGSRGSRSVSESGSHVSRGSVARDESGNEGSTEARSPESSSSRKRGASTSPDGSAAKK